MYNRPRAFVQKNAKSQKPLRAFVQLRASIPYRPPLLTAQKALELNSEESRGIAQVEKDLGKGLFECRESTSFRSIESSRAHELSSNRSRFRSLE